MPNKSNSMRISLGHGVADCLLDFVHIQSKISFIAQNIEEQFQLRTGRNMQMFLDANAVISRSHSSLHEVHAMHEK